MKPNRRALLAGGMAGMVSLVALSAQADEKGEKILRQAFQTMGQARTLTADLTSEIVMTGQPAIVSTGTVSLQKPNLINVTLDRKVDTRSVKESYISDGKKYFMYTVGAKIFNQMPIPSPLTGFTGQWEGEIDSFFGGLKNAEKVTADFAGTETLDGVVCDLVRVKMPQDRRTLTYAIGQKDHLIYRNSWTTVQDKNSITQTNRLRNIKLNGAVSSSRFAFNPPAGVKAYDPEAQMREMEAKLVKVGEEAPAFELTGPQDSQRFSLAKALEGRKAVLVNFWFYG